MIIKVYEEPEIWCIRVNLPENPLHSLNSYVICSQGENLIVDTGFNRPECQKDLWEGINELGLDMKRTRVFLTHLHSDHIGLVQSFIDCHCQVYMNEIDYNYFCNIKRGKVWPTLEALFIYEGYPKQEIYLQEEENQGRKYAPEKIFPATLVNDKQRIRVGKYELECIHTPGHTPGHTVLYLLDKQLLFSGDHILLDITPNISIWKGIRHSLADYRDSLDKIYNMPVQEVFPAHRSRGGEIKQRIEEIINHHERRLNEIMVVVEENPGINAFSVAGKIKWSARGTEWKMFPPHQKWFAMGETLAHLYYLAETGCLERREENNGVKYFPL